MAKTTSRTFITKYMGTGIFLVGFGSDSEEFESANGLIKAYSMESLKKMIRNSKKVVEVKPFPAIVEIKDNKDVTDYFEHFKSVIIVKKKEDKYFDAAGNAYFDIDLLKWTQARENAMNEREAALANMKKEKDKIDKIRAEEDKAFDKIESAAEKIVNKLSDKFAINDEDDNTEEEED